MSASAETVCIPPDRVPEVWPHVSHWINNAVGKRGDWTSAEIYERLQGDRLLLWVLWDGELRAACVTEIILVPKGQICRVVACGGGQAIPWARALAPIEQYAKEKRCASIRIEGREGWKKVLPEYELEWVCLEKGLS